MNNYFENYYNLYTVKNKYESEVEALKTQYAERKREIKTSVNSDYLTELFKIEQQILDKEVVIDANKSSMAELAVKIKQFFEQTDGLESVRIKQTGEMITVMDSVVYVVPV